MSTTSGKGACFLAWGLAVLIPAGLVASGGWTWLNRTDSLAREIATSEDKITGYRRLIATLPRLQAELEQVRSNEDAKAYYYVAPTLQLAGAQIQRVLQDVVKKSGARLISTQMLSANAEEQPPKVNIRTQIQGKTDALFDVLYRIETARPFLFVDQLSVRATGRRAVRRKSRLPGSRARPRSSQGEVTVRLDIAGYALVKGR